MTINNLNSQSSKYGDLKWLFVDMNSFFASCEQQLQPSLRGRPVGVVPFVGDTTCCLAASYEAKARGVKTGTLVAEARRLCPGMVFVEAKPGRYVEFHEQIVDVVESCLPVESILSVDEMVCELSGSQRSLEKAERLARHVKASILDRVGRCLTSSVGLATNRYLAKVASDMQKPDGLTALLRSDLPGKLLRLKPRDLPGIGAKMEQRLAMRGVHTMEQLIGCGMHEMRVLWGGIYGERMYHWLRGDEVYVPPSQTHSMGHQHVLEPELRTDQGAFAVAQKLLIKAAVRLRRGGYYARRLSLSVAFMKPRGVVMPVSSDDLHYDESMRLPETQDTLTLLKQLAVLWGGLPTGKPLRVSVVLSDLVPASQHQYSLFEDPRRERLSQAMDLINERFGKDRLHLASIHDITQAAPTRIPFNRVPEASEF